MPKTPDEIMKGLECDPLALSRQLYADNCRLKDELYNEYNVQNEQLVRINQLEAERDAAVDGLKSNCTCPECKYFSDDIQEPCRGCKPTDSKFEWRGAQKEDSTC